ncbi:MAG: UbiD family decarboxylase [SAR324 cluster bacterium]|nr:UbiD family decarboxylase [SAR324 cluster bacterium]
MPYRDLRAFLERLEREGEVLRVEEEVDLMYEVGAVCRLALDRGGVEKNRALYFSRPKGHTHPLVVNLLSTRKRYCLALECNPDEVHREWIRRTEKPIEPRIVKEGPCKEVVHVGEEANLFQLPIPFWNELDGGRYITFHSHISKDPETGVRNAGMYRAMVHDERTLGILAAPYRHIRHHFEKAHASGKSLPVAIVIGMDPSIYAATVATFPFGVDELAMAGALRGEPVEMVPCETIPLEVPATAEIVIEGEIPPGVLRDEGPFGEFTGYYGDRAPRPVIQVKAITHRKDFIFEGSYEGLPHVVLEAMSLGLPVVATAVGGTSEVLSDKVNGRLITSPRINALYEALSQLVRFPEERQRLAKGAKQTSQRFTMHKMVEETLRVLERLASTGQR